jgi:hypothetical protein
MPFRPDAWLGPSLVSLSFAWSESETPVISNSKTFLSSHVTFGFKNPRLSFPQAVAHGFMHRHFVSHRGLVQGSRQFSHGILSRKDTVFHGRFKCIERHQRMDHVLFVNAVVVQLTQTHY